MMGYAVIISVIIALIVALYCFWLGQKQNKADKEMQQLNQQEKLKQEKEALFNRIQGQEYTVLEQKEAGLLGCPPIFRWCGKEYYPVVLVERADNMWKVSLVGADIGGESWLGDEECHATIIHVKKRISAEEYDDLRKQLENGLKD